MNSIMHLLFGFMLQGVAGIGVVNAVEVVLAFPGEPGLAAFRQWVESPDGALLDAAKKAAGLGSQGEGGSQQLAVVEGETGELRWLGLMHWGMSFCLPCAAANDSSVCGAGPQTAPDVCQRCL